MTEEEVQDTVEVEVEAQPEAESSNEPTFDANKPEALISIIEKASGPVTLADIAAAAGAEEAQHADIEGMLAAYAERGEIVQTRDGRYGSPAKMNLVIGRLTCHEKGFGFVIPRDPKAEDLYIPRRKLGNALHGDLVVARREATQKHRTEGRVIRLLKRARTQVVGTFKKGNRFGYVTPLDSRIGYEVFVAEKDYADAEDGQMVTAEITCYPEGKGRRSPEGKIVEVLGDPGDPRLDIEVIIREFGLPHEFPAEVIAEAEKVTTEVTEADVEGRQDFRELPIVTIDGEHAKDFDDAVHVTKLPNGNYELQVHIADVSAYVPVGSAIDNEARRRATSVYFPDRVVPMLPESLSNEICSLKPGVDRLVQSVTIEIDRTGKTVNFDFHDGVIRSAERMTYKQVAALLEGSDEELNKRYADHVEHFKLMSELCDVLRGYRNKRGSIDFDLPEPEMRINMVGEVEDIFRSERNQAHRLIEEFMIRCNEVVASHTVWEDVASVYRVHEGPDPEKVEQFRDFIGSLGLYLGDSKSPKPADFQRLVEHLEGQPGERTIIYLMLRTMKQARYQTDNLGHFGLASPRYSHFTSPIRRYPDLLVHRLMKVDREAKTQPEFDAAAVRGQLASMCVESSERERNAESAERRYVDWKKVQFMADKVGDSFEALVSGVHAYGFFVELEEFFVEGLVHISSMTDDYYQFDERRHSLRGERSGRTLALGNRVKVQLAKVDKERRRLDFHLEEGPLETVIKPQEKAAARADAEEGGRRRRRRRRGRRGEEKPVAAKSQDGEATGDRAAKGSNDRRDAGGKQESKESSGSRRRRGRRGRGGRGKSDEQAASAGKDGGSRRDRSPAKSDDERPARRGRGGAKADDGGQRRGRSAKPDDGGQRRGRGGAKADDGGNSRRRRSRGGRSSERGGDKRAAQQGNRAQSKPDTKPDAKPATKQKVEAPKQGSGAPKVNPYLTDL